MANAVTARWHGDNYQARFFWIHASELRNPEASHVIEVSYEADGPKAFDDVIIRYSPSRPDSGPVRISADFFQIKYHVVREGRFGYEDLILPSFINAASVSLLERLHQAKQTAPSDAAFNFVTTDGIKDGDPLDELLSSQDGSLRLDKLAKGTQDRSRMGKVRKLWREHLKLKTDEELYEVLKNFRIHHFYYSLERLRQDVNLRFRVVGLTPCEHSSEFRYDAAAMALKSRGIFQFSRESFNELCQAEGWVQATYQDSFRNVALRSFSDGPVERLDATPENTLSLLQFFNGRHLLPNENWETSVRPLVEDFLSKIRSQAHHIRLFLDAHSSIAFLAGHCLGLKSGVATELIQKGMRGISVWSADDNSKVSGIHATTEQISEAADLALVLNITRDVTESARDYLAAKVPDAGRMLIITPEEGCGQRVVTGGAHAARMAEDIADAVSKMKVKIGARIHIFSAAPNAVHFFIGQQLEFMGSCVLYEFDFNRRIDGSYHPSFKVQ